VEGLGMGQQELDDLKDVQLLLNNYQLQKPTKMVNQLQTLRKPDRLTNLMLKKQMDKLSQLEMFPNPERVKNPLKLNKLKKEEQRLQLKKLLSLIKN
jgi:hypothetical protein